MKMQVKILLIVLLGAVVAHAGLLPTIGGGVLPATFAVLPAKTADDPGNGISEIYDYLAIDMLNTAVTLLLPMVELVNGYLATRQFQIMPPLNVIMESLSANMDSTMSTCGNLLNDSKTIAKNASDYLVGALPGIVEDVQDMPSDIKGFGGPFVAVILLKVAPLVTLAGPLAAFSQSLVPDA